MMKVSLPVVQVHVVIDNRPIQEYRDPKGNTFIEGRQGSNFELDMRNLTGRRLLVHPTVDGLSCMDPRYIFGVRYDFCDGDEIIAESSEEYGRQTAKVETR